MPKWFIKAERLKIRNERVARRNPISDVKPRIHWNLILIYFHKYKCMDVDLSWQRHWYKANTHTHLMQTPWEERQKNISRESQHTLTDAFAAIFCSHIIIDSKSNLCILRVLSLSLTLFRSHFVSSVYFVCLAQSSVFPFQVAYAYVQASKIVGIVMFGNWRHMVNSWKWQ